MEMDLSQPEALLRTRNGLGWFTAFHRTAQHGRVGWRVGVLRVHTSSLISLPRVSVENQETLMSKYSAHDTPLEASVC